MIPPTENVQNAESYNELIECLVELVTPLKRYNGANVLTAILSYNVDTDCLRGWIREADKSGNYADACRTKAILQLNDAIHGFLDVELLDAELLEDAEEKEVEQ